LPQRPTFAVTRPPRCYRVADVNRFRRSSTARPGGPSPPRCPRALCGPLTLLSPLRLRGRSWLDLDRQGAMRHAATGVESARTQVREALRRTRHPTRADRVSERPQASRREDGRRAPRPSERLRAPSAARYATPGRALAILIFRRGQAWSVGGCVCRGLGVRFEMIGEAAKVRDRGRGSLTNRAGSGGTRSPDLGETESM
jgi:hypothetical protein